MLILAARVLAQMQTTSAAHIHPNRSLFTLTSVLAAINLAAGLLHCLDFAGGMNGGKGLSLDFIGQCKPLKWKTAVFMMP